MKRNVEARAAVAESIEVRADVVAQSGDLVSIPAVCFIDDLCLLLRMSRRNIQRLRRHRAFPIAELPALDKRPRWSGLAVREFIESGKRSARQLVPVLSHSPRTVAAHQTRSKGHAR